MESSLIICDDLKQKDKNNTEILVGNGIDMYLCVIK